MNVFHTIIFLLVAAGGTAVVLTREPKRQVLVLSFFGMLLTILFLAIQSADVALSELAIGSAALPLMLLATLASITPKVGDKPSTSKPPKRENS